MPLELTANATVICLATVMVILIIMYKRWFSYWKNKGVPYLEPTIPFGNTAGLIFSKVNFGELIGNWYLEMKKRNWTIGGVYLCGKPIFVPVDNELIKTILISDFEFFPNRGLFIDQKLDPLSGHIFNMENYKWKNFRAKIPAAFTAAKLRKNVIIMESISKELIRRLDELALKNESLNIRETLNRYTIDIITACVFGMESKTLANENEELVNQSRPFFDNQFSRTKSTLVFLFPRHILSLFGFKLFPTDTTNYFLKMFRDIKDNREKETIKRNDLTDILMDLCDESKCHPDFNGKGKMDPLSFNEMASHMYAFFEAGFETSSTTQTFAMYELAINTEIQDRLRQEINRVLEKHNGLVGYESINEMEYLDRVVDESLRKYPVLPIMTRYCIKDYQIPGTDITLEKNTLVMVANFGIHYDPEYYPEPMKFDPNRFTPENKAKRPACSYLPFGDGPRICVGKRFGLWQTKIGILTLVRNYKISLSKKMKLPFSFDKAGLILKAQGDIWIDLEKIY